MMICPLSHQEIITPVILAGYICEKSFVEKLITSGINYVEIDGKKIAIPQAEKKLIENGYTITLGIGDIVEDVFSFFKHLKTNLSISANE